MSKKQMSTLERELQNPEFREIFEKECKEFAFSELLLAMMEEDEVSVRELAKMAGISPSVVQKLRTGEQKDLKLSNFMNIAKQFGYTVILENGENRIPINA